MISKNRLKVLIVIIVFILISFNSCNVNDGEPIENEKIIIQSDKKIIGQADLEDIKKLQSYKRRVVINSSDGSEICDFRGVLLSDVLNSVDDALIDSYSSAKVIGTDGYFSNVTIEEIKKENKVFIMYENSDMPLKSLKGKVNSMRLIVMGDDFGQRYTNYVVKIELIK